MRHKMLEIVLGLLFASLIAACPPTKGGGAAAVKKSPDAVKVEFFVMSQCPFGVQVVNGVKEAYDKLGPEIDLVIDYIGDNKDGNLNSMHGADEVLGDKLQLCAIKHAPARWMDFLVCQNKNMKEVTKNWESCAKELQLDGTKIKACADGDEGKQLLTASFAKAQQKGARGSPTMFIAGKPYSGRRGPNDFLRAICNEHPRKAEVVACSNIPEPVKVNVIVLDDKRCTECNTGRYLSMLKSRLANPEIKQLDYSDAEGKALYEQLGGKGNLPMVLFDSTLEGDKEATQMFSRGLQPLGNYKNLQVGSSWNPICANDKGCELEECKSNMICRKEEPNKLDLFAMSQCPFGVKAFNAMREVIENFGNRVDFDVHFIANGTAAEGFRALHGQPEVDENIREICAIKYYPKNFQYMDYVWCRNLNIRDDNWEACTSAHDSICSKPDDKTKAVCESLKAQSEIVAKAKKIDVARMKKCFEGTEGKKLLEEDIKIANSAGIGASPTWIANNKFKFSGIDAETIRKNICDHNSGLKGCENTLTGMQPRVAPGPKGSAKVGVTNQ
ncbi:MAG: hypothetical protein JXR83_19005, partial [Deltaproteobacteria bacterium]|nr:hypothetical protein [Deltaproteobacteria bacterium]